MSIESTFDRIATGFERIATSLESLVELEKLAMEHCKTGMIPLPAERAVETTAVEAPPAGTPATAEPVTEPAVETIAGPEENALNWNPLAEEPQLRYSSAKKEILRRLCREKGADADAMGFNAAHAFLRSGAEVAKPENSTPKQTPEQPSEAITPEVVEYTVPEVRSKLIAWVKEIGKTANDGVALITQVTGKGKLVDLTPAELAKVVGAINGAQ